MKKVLALNYSVTAAIKRKYQVLVEALPLLCMFLPFIPMMKVAYWLDSSAGASHNPIANGSSVPLMWGLLGLGVMVVAMLVGNALGWILNMAISVAFFRWPWGRVRAVFLESQLPAEWFKDGIGSQEQADASASKEWEALRRRGFAQFVMKRGVLAWGVPMFLAMYLAPVFAKGYSFSLAGLLANLGIWGLLGTTFGAAMWWWHESQYRKRDRR